MGTATDAQRSLTPVELRLQANHGKAMKRATPRTDGGPSGVSYRVTIRTRAGDAESRAGAAVSKLNPLKLSIAAFLALSFLFILLLVLISILVVEFLLALPFLILSLVWTVGSGRRGTGRQLRQ